MFPVAPSVLLRKTPFSDWSDLLDARTAPYSPALVWKRGPRFFALRASQREIAARNFPEGEGSTRTLPGVWGGKPHKADFSYTAASEVLHSLPTEP